MYDRRVRQFKFERIKDLFLDFCKIINLDPPEITPMKSMDTGTNSVTHNKITIPLNSEYYPVCAKKLFSEWLITLCVYAEKNDDDLLKAKLIRILSERFFLDVD